MNVEIVKTIDGVDYNSDKNEVYTCTLCGKEKTTMATMLCDRCWNINSIVEQNKDLVEKSINSHNKYLWEDVKYGLTEEEKRDKYLQAERKLFDFDRGAGGDFFTLLIRAIMRADNDNIEKLKISFPELVEVVKRYGREEGYWQDLEKRMQEDVNLLEKHK